MIAEEKSDDRVVRVTPIIASGLTKAKYRFGDITRRIFGDAENLIKQVYMVIELGHTKFVTDAVASEPPKEPDGNLRCAYFEQTECVLPYRDNNTLKVSVYAKRSLTSILRGDPLIGEGTFELDPSNATPLEKQVALSRNGNLHGKATISYCITSQTSESLQTELAGSKEAAKALGASNSPVAELTDSDNNKNDENASMNENNNSFRDDIEDKGNDCDNSSVKENAKDNDNGDNGVKLKYSDDSNAVDATFVSMFLSLVLFFVALLFLVVYVRERFSLFATFSHMGTLFKLMLPN